MSQDDSKRSDWRQDWRTRLKVRLAAWGGIAAVRLLGATLRVRAHPFEDIVEQRGDGGAAIFAMWHGPLFPYLWAYRGRGVTVITSQSADGEILTRVIENLGHGAVRGSSTRGGRRALIDLARCLEGGRDVVVAVDGPKGPLHRVKPGVVLLAKLTGRPIIPCAASPRRYWELGSWDRFRLPWPGTTALTRAGRALRVPRDASDGAMEQARAELERRLTALQAEVDRDAAKG